MENGNHVVNKNIEGFRPLVPPIALTMSIPLEGISKETVKRGRETIESILRGEDSRKIVIVGPCSIHNPTQGIEYAQKLKELSDQVKDKLYVVMRTYFEKPRTSTGWKGLINDPNLDDSFDIENGLKIARQFLLDVAKIGLPAATEFLDPNTPQYISDLISWGAIGARTTESQTHREMASGLSMPVGFKNSTSGGYAAAINALKSSRRGQHFLGINEYGNTCEVITKGNKHLHIIFRGGEDGPNYYEKNIEDIQATLRTEGLSAKVLVDCSHGNSSRDFRKQSEVFYDVLGQMERGNKDILGWMIESNLNEGGQTLDPEHPERLKYGVSITDGCIGWYETERLIKGAYERLKSAV